MFLLNGRCGYRVSGQIEIAGIVAADPGHQFAIRRVWIAQEDAVPFQVIDIGGGGVEHGRQIAAETLKIEGARSRSKRGGFLSGPRLRNR